MSNDNFSGLIGTYRNCLMLQETRRTDITWIFPDLSQRRRIITRAKGKYIRFSVVRYKRFLKKLQLSVLLKERHGEGQAIPHESLVRQSLLFEETLFGITRKKGILWVTWWLTNTKVLCSTKRVSVTTLFGKMWDRVRSVTSIGLV